MVIPLWGFVRRICQAEAISKPSIFVPVGSQRSGGAHCHLISDKAWVYIYGYQRLNVLLSLGKGRLHGREIRCYGLPNARIELLHHWLGEIYLTGCIDRQKGAVDLGHSLVQFVDKLVILLDL